MKLTSYKVQGYPPIREFEVGGLADIVVLAGPNGVGKTSLLTSLLNIFQNPERTPNAVAEVEATSHEEAEAWGQKTLNTSTRAEATKLRVFLQRNQKRGQLRSGLINFDSGRQLEQIQPYGFSWDFRDPFFEDVGWNFSFQPMDKQTYGSIVGSLFPELVLVPVGGKENLGSFVKAFDTVLNKTIWGVDFFMLCDGDTSAGLKASGDDGARMRLLPRYHIENYFLDERVLAAVFQGLDEPEGSWLRDPSRIRAEIRALAQSSLSYAAALNVAQRVRTIVGSIDLMPSACHGKDAAALAQLFEARRTAETGRVQGALDSVSVEKDVHAEFDRLSDLLSRDDDEWLRLIPGKVIFQQFAARTPLDATRLKRLYLKQASASAPDPFAEIKSIFKYFASFGQNDEPLAAT